MDNKLDLTVSVNVKVEDDDKAIFSILFPENQQKLTLMNTTDLLVGGLSLLIKSADKFDDDIKDYELIEIINKKLNDLFISTTSFNDAEIDKKPFKNK